MIHRTLPFSCFLVACWFASPAAAQVTWTRAAAINGRLGSGLAYDFARDRLVLFGGQVGPVTEGDTWESAGAGWALEAPAVRPVGRASGVMGHDPLRSCMILFGGRSLVGGTTLLADTWSWDGTTWTQRFPAASPPARYEGAMTWDGTNGRLVLFGGNAGTADSADMWEWDGANWTQVPTSGPSARHGHAIAHDPGRQRLVLFGGRVASLGSYEATDTWEWDGTTWQQQAPVTSPPGLRNHTMLYRATTGRVLLFGGKTFPLGTQNASWEWDGTNWTQLATSPPPPAREYHSMAWDMQRHRAVVFGGWAANSTPVHNDTWYLDAANTWSTVPLATPPLRTVGTLAADTARGRLVLFGGQTGPLMTPLADTWEWSGSPWVQRLPATSPSARRGHAAATDPVTGNVLLFGGRGATGNPLADMWEWLGTTWAPIAVAGPPGRMGHRMCANEQDRTILLFGGVDPNQGQFGDTWRFDAVARTWAQLGPANHPSPRDNYGLARDPHRDRIVLFGGYVNGFVRDDTWEWDGVDWLQRFPTTQPPPRSVPGMTHDPERDRIVLHGGGGGLGLLFGDTWEWDGTDWTQRAPLQLPPVGTTWTMVWDPGRARTFLLKGAETWRYGPVYPAGWSDYGTGCPGSAGTPVLRPAPFSLPWLGDTFALRVDPVAAGQSAFAVFGTRVSWGSTLLPLPLDSYGMPGCVLLAGGYSVHLAAANGGGALVAVPLPNAPALVGATVDAQAFVTDPAANAAGLVASRGGTMRVGGR